MLPTSRSRALTARALVGLALLVAWTAIVRIGISEGSRHTVWAAQRFGSWPASFHALAGSANVALSLHATYDSGGTLGWTTVGAATDFGDPQNINGSRFVTGTVAGRVRSMSVHVAAPVDPPPHDRFELAIYADDRGAPGQLLAQSARGTLAANAWNTVAISAALSPRTAYWLMYNTNGSSDQVNNLTLTPLVATALDSVIRAPRGQRLDGLARLLHLAGHPAVTVVALLLTAWWLGPGRVGFTVALGTGLAVATALELVSKYTLFAPYAAYPSGHALRVTFVATAVCSVTARGSARLGVLTVAILSSLGTIRTNSHYAEEAVGGALAGWALATSALAVRAWWLARAGASESRPLRTAFNRRVAIDRRRHERRRGTASATPG